MKIIHSVQFSPDEVESLFEVAKKAGEMVVNPAYSAEEKEKMQLDYLEDFSSKLAAFGVEAFDHGHMIGKSFPIR